MSRILLTGGHHSSAIPVIKELRERDSKIKLYWVGHRRSQKGNKSDTLEYQEIRALNIPFHHLSAGKFHKTFNPFRLAKIPIGFIQAAILLYKINPDVIVSFGGYIAVPVVIMGWVFGIPSVTHEQTVIAGHANKLLSKFSEKILISWETSKKHFPKHKTVYTGIPLRESILESKSNEYKVDNKFPTIYVTGGKTGSHKINMVVRESLNHLLSFCNVIHQCGDNSATRDFEILTKKAAEVEKEKTKGKYILKKYILEEEIGEVFQKATLVVSRAGAHTISELMVLNKPGLLIPIPWVSHNEQYENALMLSNLGLTRILEEKDLDAAALAGEIGVMLSSVDSFRMKEGFAKNLIRDDSAELIVDEILKIYKK
jgi:UDP-N-acetylglucosamine--N-acetylmuramyl-(pentapeptide) pyrophosphoryl-undecaprenol N-acetylglucosamine transferase